MNSYESPSREYVKILAASVGMAVVFVWPLMRWAAGLFDRVSTVLPC